MLRLLKLLVCQGKCNPRWQSVNDDVVAFRVANPPSGDENATMPIPPDEFIEQLHALNYTSHEVGASGFVAKCQVCNSVRLYGVE